MDRFCSRTLSPVASGTNRSLLCLYSTVFPASASLEFRGRVYKVAVASAATPNDQAADFYLGRTTNPGTQGSGSPPNCIDPVGNADANYGASFGTFSVEPTYTAGQQLLGFQLNQEVSFEWEAEEGYELLLSGLGLAGAGLKTVSSTSTQSHGACVFYRE